LWWTVLIVLFLAQMLIAPSGFVFPELLDPTASTDSQEFDDVASHFHRLRFVRDTRVSVAPDDSEPCTLDSVPPLEPLSMPYGQAASAHSSRFEHRSTLTRRSRAPGALSRVNSWL
jgi:hypothetical protein